MASQPSFKVSGRAAIIKALRGLDAAAPEIIKGAVTDGLQVYEKEVRRRAPRPRKQSIGPRQTPPIRTNIKSRVRKKDTAVTGLVITPPNSVFTEYGFLHVRSGKRIEAKPWIRPAFEAKTPDAERVTLEKMQRGIEDHVRRNAPPDADS